MKDVEASTYLSVNVKDDPMAACMDLHPLERWYVEHGRHDLPWRHTQDPWHILVSEVMLHQTQVHRVLGYWELFISRWPTPQAFADAPLPDILRSWKGLGYPRRARNLQASASTIARTGWPEDEQGLLALPGVGTYTARAMRIIAWNDPDCLLPRDVNITRIFQRLSGSTSLVEPVGWQGTRRDLVYALFDLGSLICRARTPLCQHCPVQAACYASTRENSFQDKPTHRQAPFHGSFRELRSAVLQICIAEPSISKDTLKYLCSPLLGRVPEQDELDRALHSLVTDGLLDMMEEEAT